jgi:glycopeptide antibiotics resistance protein
MVLVAIVSLLPPSMIVQSGFYFRNMDKWVHGTMYCILAVLLFLVLPQKTNIRRWIITVFTFILAFVYSLVLELLQGMIISLSRSFEWEDLWANATGAIAGILIMILIDLPIRKKALSG